MKGTKFWLALVVTLVSFGMWNSATQAEDTNEARATLRAIEAVCVQVKHFDPELRVQLGKGGLTEDALQIAVERKLEAAGIKVLSEEKISKSDCPAFLYVNFQILVPETKFTYTVEGEQISKDKPVERYFYGVDIELRQMVSLKRDLSAEAFSITWQVESVGMRRLALIKDDIKRLVDVFIEAYISENPDSIKK